MESPWTENATKKRRQTNSPSTGTERDAGGSAVESKHRWRDTLKEASSRENAMESEGQKNRLDREQTEHNEEREQTNLGL